MDEINWNSLSGKRIAITGGLGFVGVNLVNKLLESKIEPVIVDFRTNLDTKDDHFIPFNLERMEFYNVNIANQKDVQEKIGELEVDIVIHLASMTNLTKNFDFARKSINVNIIGTLNLLEILSPKKIDNFIFLSTSDVYGEIEPPFSESQIIFPASPYSVSKAAAEMYLLLFNKIEQIPITILRSFNLFGKYQPPVRIIPFIIQKLINNEIVELTEGKQKREFNYVDNLLDAIYLSINNKNSIGEIINIGNGKSTSIKDIALKIGALLEKTELLKFGAIPYRANEIWDMYCDNSKAKGILNWEPKIKFEDGLERTIKWWKNEF